VRFIPLIPWWLLAKLLRIGQFERDYDWSLHGMMRTPVRRSAILLGWTFWVIVILAILILLIK
jgi:hypothetical protein